MLGKIILTLDQLNIKQKAIISSINCDEILKNRLYSFGIIKGATITVEGNYTYKVQLK